MSQKIFISALLLMVLISCHSREEKKPVITLEAPLGFNDESASDESPCVQLVGPCLASHSDAPFLPPRVRKGSTILLVGDSLGVGMSDKFKELARDAGYQSVTKAISGTSTFQWVFWIKKHLETYKPSLVLVSLGTNDAIQLERAKKSDVYAEMSKIVQDFGAELVWIVPHKIDLKRIPKIDLTREFIRSSVPLSFDSTRVEIPLSPDHVHTSKAGYDKWMKEVWKWLVEINMIEKYTSQK